MAKEIKNNVTAANNASNNDAVEVKEEVMKNNTQEVTENNVQQQEQQLPAEQQTQVPAEEPKESLGKRILNGAKRFAKGAAIVGAVVLAGIVGEKIGEAVGFDKVKAADDNLRLSGGSGSDDDPEDDKIIDSFDVNE